MNNIIKRNKEIEVILNLKETCFNRNTNSYKYHVEKNIYLFLNI